MYRIMSTTNSMHDFLTHTHLLFENFFDYFTLMWQNFVIVALNFYFNEPVFLWTA